MEIVSRNLKGTVIVKNVACEYKTNLVFDCRHWCCMASFQVGFTTEVLSISALQTISSNKN